MVIVDTSALIAFFSEDDSCHEKAVKDFLFFTSKQEIFLINNFVVNEFITLINLRYKDMASELFKFVKKTIKGSEQGFIYRFIDKADFEEVINLAMSYSLKGLSVTDCSLMFTAKQYYDAKILTYDKKLQKAYL